MIRKIFNLFIKYTNFQMKIVTSGGAIIAEDGQLLAFIDRVSFIGQDHVAIEGWTRAKKVSVTTGTRKTAISPNMTRSDLPDEFSDAKGFHVDVQSGRFTPVITVYDGNDRYLFMPPLPQRRQRQVARLRHVFPFIMNMLRATPAGLRYAFSRDRRHIAQIKRIFRFPEVTVLAHARLSHQLFASPIDASSTIGPKPSDLTRHGSAISIVLPVYNGLNLLPEVLQRVLDHTDAPWRLLIIEDCSSDSNVRPWLRDWHASLPQNHAKNVQIFENDTNLGFIASVNRGLSAAIPYGDHVVLLNSDAFVPTNWASRIIAPFKGSGKIASVTPMSNDAEIFNVPFICQRNDLDAGEADAIDKIASGFDAAYACAPAPTGVGFCMAMNISALHDLPLLDCAFGRGYGEEVDWCQRARVLGWEHVGIANLFVEHRGGSSFGSIEKLRLMRKNGAVITKRYPRYDMEVQQFIKNDPLFGPRFVLGLAWLSLRQSEEISVYIGHSLGGGAEVYLQQRIAAELENKVGAIVLRVGGAARWRVELHSVQGIVYTEIDDDALLLKVMATLGQRRVIYSCGVGHPDPVTLPKMLRSLAQDGRDRIEVLVHDYLALSPDYTLLGTDGVWKGVPRLDGPHDPKNSSLRPDGSVVDLRAWREAWGELFTQADEICVFSQNSRMLFLEAYPKNKNTITVRPHKLAQKIKSVSPVKPKDNIPVIGVLGNIGYIKGSAILQDLSKYLDQNQRARIVVFGNVDPKYRCGTSVKIMGEYSVSDITNLAQYHAVCAWFIPSICPETFSYTTHEAIATGLPVFGFNLGAQGDAILNASKKSGRGAAINIGSSAAEIVDIILENSKISMPLKQIDINNNLSV